MFFIISCNKEEIIVSPELSINEQNTASERFVPCTIPYEEVFANHFQNYRTTDPKTYFPEKFYEAFKSELSAEKEVMQGMGFEPYVKTLVEKQEISAQAKDLVMHIYQSVSGEEDVLLVNLKNDLKLKYSPSDVLVVSDPFYCYVYNIAMEIYNNYYGGHSGNVKLRGDCDFKDFVKHVIESAVTGAGIGDILGSLLHDEDGFFVINALGVVIEVTGAIIGGAIGAIVGLFTHDSNGCEDCHPVDNIVVTSDSDCDLTRTLSAIGAGPDALAFEWRITQNGITTTITTTDPTVVVTQASDDEPIQISVASLCLPEDEDDISNATLTPFTPTIEIDLSTSANSPLGQPGEITLNAFTGALANIGNDPIVTEVNKTATFFWSNSNQASGHIETTYSIIPASMGIVTQVLNNGAVKVKWTNPGAGSFRVVSVNTCSGLSTYRGIPVTVNQ